MVGRFLEPIFAFGNRLGKASALDEQFDELLAYRCCVGLALQRSANGFDSAVPVLLQATHLCKAQVALQRCFA